MCDTVLYIPHILCMVFGTYILFSPKPFEGGFWRGQTITITFGGIAHPHTYNHFVCIGAGLFLCGSPWKTCHVISVTSCSHLPVAYIHQTRQHHAINSISRRADKRQYPRPRELTEIHPILILTTLLICISVKFSFRPWTTLSFISSIFSHLRYFAVCTFRNYETGKLFGIVAAACKHNGRCHWTRPGSGRG